MDSQLTLRNEGPETTRDFVSRLATLRAATVDEATFSVEVVMATEAPVAVLDVERFEVIDEVLIAAGGQYPPQMVLLEDHARTVEKTLGSIRNIRREGEQWIGRAYFDDDDPNAMRAWHKVRKGHITDVSIGYRSLEYVDIPAGQRAAVAGREFTAGPRRRLRVTTRYQPRECSVTPIGADQNAKVRSGGEPPHNNRPGDNSGREICMDPQLRKFLESLGLRSDASEADAKRMLAELQGTFRALADQLAGKTITLERAEAGAKAEFDAMRSALATKPVTPPATTTPAASPQVTRLEPIVGQLQTATLGVSTAGEDALRAEAVRLERERVTQIRQLAGNDTEPELVQRAEAEGWTVDRASREFLKSLREGRQPSVAADGGTAPGGIVRNHERDCNRESLGLALFMRSVGDDQAKLKAVVERVNKDRARNGQQPLVYDNVAQMAHRYDDMSLVDVCRESIRLDNRQCPYGRDMMIRAAVSGGSLLNIFTTSVNAVLLSAYDEEPDTTDWVEEGEVADFKQNTAIRFSAKSGLKKLGRGGTADDISLEDSAEGYKIARYAEKGSVDEQDIIDDSLNALSEIPGEMGKDVGRLRPDLVYAMVLANPTMDDTGAVYNSTALTTAGGHANYAESGSADALGAALSAGSLQNAVTAVRKQYKGTGRNKKILNIIPTVLLVPPELQFTAEIILASAERHKDSNEGTFNPLKGKMRPVVENRIGVVGVTDPDSGTAYTGTATNYFLFARPGLHVKVAYRRGTGRGPTFRSYTLDKGQWGIGYDVNLDIGCKFVEFRGTFKAKGAA